MRCTHPRYAEQLRDRDHDAEGVTERAGLRARSDADLFALAQQEQRTVVTENIDDFSVIAGGYDHSVARRTSASFSFHTAATPADTHDDRAHGHRARRLLGEHPDAADQLAPLAVISRVTLIGTAVMYALPVSTANGSLPRPAPTCQHPNASYRWIRSM